MRSCSLVISDLRSEAKVSRFKMVVRSETSALLLPLQSCDLRMVVKENPDTCIQKKNSKSEKFLLQNFFFVDQKLLASYYWLPSRLCIAFLSLFENFFFYACFPSNFEKLFCFDYLE